MPRNQPALALILSLCACSGGFVKSEGDGTVSHRIRDLAGNAYDRALPIADPHSFVKINVNYGKDKRAAYFQNSRIEGAHSATFTALSRYYARDKNNVYFQDLLIDNADPDTFRLVNGGKNSVARDLSDYYYGETSLGVADPDNYRELNADWGRDGVHYYYISQFRKKGKLLSDYKTTIILNSSYAKDRDKAYFRMQAIPDAKTETFEPLSDLYARDNLHVYYMGNVIEGADPASFRVDFNGFGAEDKYSIYSFGKKISK